MSRRLALLTNPSSGKGRGARVAAEAAPLLRSTGCTVDELEGADGAEALALARRAVADGVDALVVVGGDGMVHLAVQALAGTGVPLGLVPAGTGNDVARYLDVPRGDTPGAVDVVLGGRTRPMDLARAGPTWYATVLATGFDSRVNERANDMTWPRGQMRYNLATLAELRVFEPLAYTLELDGVVRQVEAMVVAVGNGPSFGGGLRICDGALLDDGLLDVVIIKTMSKLELVRTYPKLFRGTHVHHPAYERHRVRHGDRGRGGDHRLRGRRAGGAAAADRHLRPGRGAGAGPVSAAERYARSRQRAQHPVLADFTGLYPFALDAFQVQACRHLEEGDGVLVAAPTGSGKTVVGEFAIHLALAQGRKAFYTTPIKALSNQKYADLVERYGSGQVGLLTGDRSVNGEAPVVVMTTEVLRNMIYAGSSTLTSLGFVVMDEVHYLADRSRGAVWEEVIIGLPESVAVVSLSATVSNAEEFGEWLATVRGSTATIVEERRPVPLYQHVLVGRRLYDLFADPGPVAHGHDGRSRTAHADPLTAPGEPAPAATVNPELTRVAREDAALARVRDRRPARGGKRPRRGPEGSGSRRAWTPSRVDVVRRLEREGLLPAIVFVFSRAGCDAAVQQVLGAGVHLTTPEQRDEIVRFVTEHCRHIPEPDLAVLGYHEFVEGLSRGVAAHHAGMLPTFKECVELLFQRGLCQVVFATETLALGINMPARSVVLEKLSKWNGEQHADITPGEYTQLTGRAGRRGIDVEGHGVVLWQPGLDPRSVAGLASTRTYPLRSSFRPSYNMAVNQVAQLGRRTARELLESSFAQFQADRAVVGLARKLRKTEDALAGYADAAACHLGDFLEYAALRRSLSDVEQSGARARRADTRDAIVASLEALRPGDVIDVPSGKFHGFAVVVDPGTARAGSDGPRPYVVTQGTQARRLSMSDFTRPVASLSRMRVPRTFEGANPQSRRDLASALRSRVQTLPASAHRDGPRGRRASAPVDSLVEEQVARLRGRLREHPCHGCSDREEHARWAERHLQLERDAEKLRRRVESRTHSIAREFDRVCEVLESLGYLEGDTVTADGTRLRRLYAELDLLAAEALREGLWDGLSPAELAGALSVLVYTSRGRDEDDRPRLPHGPLADAVRGTRRLWGELERTEKDHGVAFLREPDEGFAWAAWRWASGDDLQHVLSGANLAAGDFVRQAKQLLDLAGQVAAGRGLARRAGGRPAPGRPRATWGRGLRRGRHRLTPRGRASRPTTGRHRRPGHGRYSVPWSLSSLTSRTVACPATPRGAAGRSSPDPAPSSGRDS